MKRQLVLALQLLAKHYFTRPANTKTLKKKMVNAGLLQMSKHRNHILAKLKGREDIIFLQCEEIRRPRTVILHGHDVKQLPLPPKESLSTNTLKNQNDQ